MPRTTRRTTRSRKKVEPEPEPEPELEQVPETASEQEVEEGEEAAETASLADAPPVEEEQDAQQDTVVPSPNDENENLSLNAGSTTPAKAVPASRGVEEEDPPRLMISNLTLENFKSYAGRKQIGPFHKCFSAVVGPNGSGKSNVVDSLLFVFGFRSSKLRLNRLSELIHNSEQYPNLNSATVEVEFQYIKDVPGDPDAYDVVPNTKFTVARTAYRNNTSTYYINGRKCTYQDVQTRLMDCGVDLSNNRFLILQGEVEQISLMKPKGATEHEDGLLEYIEDIIGSSRYIKDIDAAYAAIEESNEEYAQKLNRCKTVLKEKDGLEGAKREAEQYLSAEREIVDSEARLSQLEIHEVNNTITALSESRQAAEAQLEAARESMSSQVAELDKLEVEYSKLEQEHKTIAEQMATTKAEFTEFERKKEKINQDLKHLKNKAKKTISARDKDIAKMNESERTLATMASDLERFEKQVSELTERQQAEEERLEEMQVAVQKKTQGLRDEVEQKKEELLPKRKAVSDLEQEIKLAQSELDMLMTAKNQAETALAEAEDAREEAVSFVEETKQRLMDENAEIQELSAKIPKLENKLNGLETQEKELSEKVHLCRMRSEEASSMQREANNSGKLISSLMAYSKKHPNLSVRGRLGDLGSIDDAYDVAISTACGALDNIVVDTESDAKICVQFLKEKKLGRATFIMLDKISSFQAHMHKPFSAPKGSRRLFDLVKPVSEDIRPAFYFALRDTVVAANIDDATAIAYSGKNLRVVTQDGAVIDQSGTMSGGGNRVQKGGMRSAARGPSISPKEVAEIERTLRDSLEELNRVRDTREATSQELHSTSQRLETLRDATEKLEMKLEAKESEIEELNARIPQLKKKANRKDTSHDARIQELEQVISDLSGPLEEAQAALEVVEEEMNAIQEKIMKAGGNKVKAQRTCVNDIVTQLDSASGEITRINVQKKATEKQIAKLQKAIEKAELLVEEIQNELIATKEAKESLRTEAEAVVERFNAAQIEVEEKEEQLKDFKSSYSVLKKQVTKLQSAEVDLVNKFETADQQHVDALNHIRACEERMQKLRQRKETFVLDPSDATQVELQLLAEDELSSVSVKELKRTITRNKEALEGMKPNMAAIEQYRKKEEEYQARWAEVVEVDERRDQQRAACDLLRTKRYEDFMRGYSMINTKLKQMYRMITLGGDAELEFVDTLDPFSEGLVFSVRPPKKSWKNIANLSGGEKTLSSLSLVFALHHYKPTPLYFMDEIDAALDFKNVSIVAHYIKERTKNAQFIIISLRHNMFDLADRLVGIYKTQNCTKSVTVNPREHSMSTAPVQ
eukprot:TRINITY_DN4347_c0_g2_i1.p1 TRINITY_DN4347_c0_g2~~TRINITY_DN4347_c0_g2_i1.p1  ORF type:complete len:1334 (+),score=421.86 TRINITY_DN4347_c0_g2_i1:39-4004(+)